MKTSAVLSLRYLTSKIHPPLSLNYRDSQKLLTLLTTSFRAHLDQEHGKIGSSKTSATDVHLQSVLDNPLFSISPHSRLHSRYGGIEKNGHGSARIPEGVEGLHSNAVEHFEEHVRSGTASIDLAKLCLQTYLKGFRGVGARRVDLKLPSKVSGIMLQWLWSSGLEGNLNFLRDSKFVALIVPFLLVDGRDRHVYDWLLRLRSELTGSSLSTFEDSFIRDNFRMQANIVHNMIASEANYGSGLNSAIREFLRNVGSTSEWFNTFPDLLRARTSNFNTRWALQRAGDYIVRRLALLPTTSAVDLVGYERLLQRIESWSGNVSFDRAQLALLHPVAPNPLLSLQYIRKEMQDATHIYTPRQKSQAINLCFGTSEILLSKGQHMDARWILNFVRKTFPQEIGNLEHSLETAASGQRESAAAKTDWGLRQLEALAFV
ncbi:hypothetical protein MMC17_008767 [Xylographa soralifera]|nr:hypothetical protein [Xylographa soralifera]